MPQSPPGNGQEGDPPGLAGLLSPNVSSASLHPLLHRGLPEPQRAQALGASMLTSPGTVHSPSSALGDSFLLGEGGGDAIWPEEQ